jgi:hypothetical protein
MICQELQEEKELPFSESALASVSDQKCYPGTDESAIRGDSPVTTEEL